MFHPLLISIYGLVLLLWYVTDEVWILWAFCIGVIIAPLVSGIVRALRVRRGRAVITLDVPGRYGPLVSDDQVFRATAVVEYTHNFWHTVLQPLRLEVGAGVDSEGRIIIEDCRALTPDMWERFQKLVQTDWAGYHCGGSVDVLLPYDDAQVDGWVMAHIEVGKHSTTYLSKKPEERDT